MPRSHLRRFAASRWPQGDHLSSGPRSFRRRPYDQQKAAHRPIDQSLRESRIIFQKRNFSTRRPTPQLAASIFNDPRNGISAQRRANARKWRLAPQSEEYANLRDWMVAGEAPCQSRIIQNNRRHLPHHPLSPSAELIKASSTPLLGARSRGYARKLPRGMGRASVAAGAYSFTLAPYLLSWMGSPANANPSERGSIIFRRLRAL
jgi:hypothetical protein